MQIVEDIRPLADLENNTGEILKQLRETGRPIVLTVKGKADAVLMDAKTYEKHLRAANLSRLLAPAEADVAAGRVRSARGSTLLRFAALNTNPQAFFIGNESANSTCMHECMVQIRSYKGVNDH